MLVIHMLAPMPIKPENRSRYPKEWPLIRLEVLRRARYRCECRGECGKHREPCDRIHGNVLDGEHRVATVVLTVAHMDHVPENCDPSNLRAWCQRCHLAYDQAHHLAGAAATRSRKAVEARLTAGEIPLFPEGGAEKEKEFFAEDDVVSPMA